MIRIIGCGVMGGAIAHVLAESGKEIALFDRHPERAEQLAHAIPVAHLLSSPLEGHTFHDILFLAFKPQDFLSSLKELEGFEGRLIISILAGVSVQQLKEAFPDIPVLRMMPNLAVRYGDGIVALAHDPALASLKYEIEQIFSALGLIRWFEEKKFDAITALAGSGPAFVFALMEAMVDAAINMGFTATEGYELVKQMVGGSLTTLYESSELPAPLKWKVCSPAGTTIAGLRTFEAKGVASGLIETFLSAYKRSQELSLS